MDFVLFAYIENLKNHSLLLIIYISIYYFISLFKDFIFKLLIFKMTVYTVSLFFKPKQIFKHTVPCVEVFVLSEPALLHIYNLFCAHEQNLK